MSCPWLPSCTFFTVRRMRRTHESSPQTDAKIDGLGELHPPISVVELGRLAPSQHTANFDPPSSSVASISSIDHCPQVSAGQSMEVNTALREQVRHSLLNATLIRTQRVLTDLCTALPTLYADCSLGSF
jgi:hypothetical protein